jgi:uncharacterized protein YecE (DUF72 family)
MRVAVGTSGYAYKEWKGHFYPDDIKPADFLRFYGTKFRTVEINNTFYRMPKSTVLERWASQVPESFRFSLKASRRITHQQRLKDVATDVGYLVATAQVLGDKLGVLLFQLPPSLRKAMPRLEAFLAALPEGVRVALEFRHESWFDDEVYGKLKERNVALCISDEGEGEKAVPFVATADFGYLRLRRETYSDEELADVARRVAAETWPEAYAFFKHEEGAPDLAARLQRLFP